MVCNSRFRHAAQTAATAVLVLFALSACQVRLIGWYDQSIDAGATQLQRSFEGFFLEMMELSQSELTQDVRSRTYVSNRGLYRQAQVEISSMLVRAKAIPHNERTVEQLELLSDTVESLRQLHIAGGEQGLRPAIAEPARSAINAHLGAIIKLELAKRRGSD